jgi:hypothetical protein
MRKIGKGIHKLHCFLVGNLIGRFMYSKDYFPRGRHFNNWKSAGWEWVISDFWGRFLFSRHRGVKWPISPQTNIWGNNIVFNPDDINNFQSGNAYFQANDAYIYIGHGTVIAQGVGIITSNHDINDLTKRSGAADVRIGDNCWIGMNSVLLPGVILGNHTIVGAGSVVTHSFKDGNCVIAGNPAKIIKQL